MRTLSKALTCMWLGGALLAAGKASADSITFYFELTVTEVFGQGYLDESVTPGTPFSGSYTFDSETPNSSKHPRVGEYDHWNPPNGIRVEVGNYSQRVDAANPYLGINIRNDFMGTGNDSYRVIGPVNESLGAPHDPLVWTVSVHWLLTSPPGDPFSGVELLTVPPSLDAWRINEFSLAGTNPLILGGDPTIFRITGEVTRIVPEPGHLGLLGLLGVLGLRRFVGS